MSWRPFPLVEIEKNSRVAGPCIFSCRILKQEKYTASVYLSTYMHYGYQRNKGSP